MNRDQLLDTLLPMQPRLQLTAQRLLGSEAEAEDAVQELVVDLWQRRGELERVVNLEAYALQALKHRCITLLRRRKPTVGTEMLDNLSDEAIAAEAALAEERAAQLDAMMGRLPEVQRRAVQMRYIDGLTHEQMQHELHMSSSNVYTTLSRAVSALRTMIKPR